MIRNAGGLAAIVSALPPETPVLYADKIMTAEDAAPGAAGLVLVAELVTLTRRPATPITDTDGQKYDTLVPGLLLGVQAIPDGGEPATGNLRAFLPPDRMYESFYLGDLLTGFTGAGEFVADLASFLTSTDLDDPGPALLVPPPAAPPPGNS